MLKSILAISLGASAGALLRWALGCLLNAAFPPLFLGTLSANLLGGYLMGFALAVFVADSGIPEILRLMIVTGFLGGLTTFSTFSAEVVMLLQQGRPGWACWTIGLNVIGTLVMTFLGIGTFNLIRQL